MKDRARVGDLYLESDKLLWKITPNGMECVQSIGGWYEPGKILNNGDTGRDWHEHVAEYPCTFVYQPSKEDNVNKLLTKIDKNDSA